MGQGEPVPPLVIVAEPDEQARNDIASAFAEVQIEVLGAASGEEALELARGRRPELLVSELVLPDITGLGLCRLIREDEKLASVPILLTTRYTSEIDRIIAFEAGIDDWVPKPLSLNELRARVRAILRRPQSEVSRRAPDPPLAIAAAGMVDELPAEVQALESHLIEATPRELQILVELVRQEGRVVSREALLERVWRSPNQCAPRTVDAHVKSLRKKLGPKRACIRTVRGVGYRFESGELERSG